ncbi:alpha/beta fold hydrolase [Saccharomonospora xinjiangensis]|uniref:alpha/beta hydrolase n=1 Tax=Saccharomonospora xinjiangensis TaxID=75294 RepID=UPI00106FCD96|nr:alpha/beta fold hydrolase [Saccharomonospora xinjiangensis]QBQ60212.1 Alpha/beta hydrolase family protein [Saccharomonospora xinjiangensis]
MKSLGEGRPSLSTLSSSGSRPRAVALVLHGGAEYGADVVRPWRLAYLRMVPVAQAIRSAGARHGLEVRLLRNRVRGWNEPHRHPVEDARWALRTIRAERPGLPVVLVGHSMGGRVALQVCDDEAVRGVCAFAPWTPESDPVEPVTGRTVVIAHGVLDRVTGPGDSYRYAERADAHAERLARFDVAAESHALLRRPAVWNRLAAEFAVQTARLLPERGLLARAFAQQAPLRWRLTL